jgi:hypothetical protein
MLTIEFLFKDGGLTFAEADLMSGVHRYKTTEAEENWRNTASSCKRSGRRRVSRQV